MDVHDAYKKNKALARDVLKEYTELQEFAEGVAQIPIDELQTFHKNEIQKSIDSVSSSVSELFEELRREAKNPRGSLSALKSAIGDRNVLIEHKQTAKEHLATMEAVQTELHVVSEALSQRSGKEVFKPSFSAEHNPPSVHVDLGSVENHPAPDTFERKLKVAVLRNGSTSHVGATAVGQAGVGKTCALRANAHDKEIHARFPGGVYFSTLRQDAREGQVKQELCNVQTNKAPDRSPAVQYAPEKGLKRKGNILDITNSPGWGTHV